MEFLPPPSEEAPYPMTESSTLSELQEEPDFQEVMRPIHIPSSESLIQPAAAVVEVNERETATGKLGSYLKYGLIALLLAGILFAAYYVFYNRKKATSNSSSVASTTSTVQTRPSPSPSSSSSSSAFPTGTSTSTSTSLAPYGAAGYNAFPNAPGKTLTNTNRMPPRRLTGNLVHDTQMIFPLHSVVTIWSPYSRHYLRMVNQDEAMHGESVIAAGGAVVQADGQDPHDKSCQWIVKPPFRYQGAVRLDNAAYDALYLSEAVSQEETNSVVVKPGVGTSWSDFVSTAAHFVDEEQFQNDFSRVFLLGVEVAVLNDIEHVLPDTHYLIGTSVKGTMLNAVHVTPGPSSLWIVRVVGRVDEVGEITYAGSTPSLPR